MNVDAIFAIHICEDESIIIRKARCKNVLIKYLQTRWHSNHAVVSRIVQFVFFWV